jgi:HD-GYP domain-containing protein (c-di-GMP phosphodiesterase class II)
MMTIADIYDALVAWDRPYKKSVPVERALDILGDEAAHGKLDGDLLSLFIEAKVYEKTLPRAGATAEIVR